MPISCPKFTSNWWAANSAASVWWWIASRSLREQTKTHHNPKKSLGLQTEPNLQIGGTLNFEEIQKPELNLIVNGYDIYFAKLENLNLNGVTDLTVSIIGKNVLDLQGSLKIKKSNGFLVPLADTEFETEHRIRNIDEEKWIR